MPWSALVSLRLPPHNALNLQRPALVPGVFTQALHLLLRVLQESCVRAEIGGRLLHLQGGVDVPSRTIRIGNHWIPFLEVDSVFGLVPSPSCGTSSSEAVPLPIMHDSLQ